MPTLNPPPQQIPSQYTADQDSNEFFNKLKDALYTLWYACGGTAGLPTLNIMSNHDSGGGDGYNEMTGSTATPAVDPGWGDCATTDMTPPDGYIRFRVGTRKVCVPYWFEDDEEEIEAILDADGNEILDADSDVIIES
jgi:hypothetical protein